MVKQLLLMGIAMLSFTTCQTTKVNHNAFIVTMNPTQFARIIQNPSVQLVDVRTPEEYRQGHLPQATLIDVKRKYFKRKIKQLDRQKAVAVYCKGGVRSMKAAEILKEKGFKVYNLKEGFQSWEGRVER